MGYGVFGRVRSESGEGLERVCGCRKFRLSLGFWFNRDFGISNGFADGVVFYRFSGF